MAVVTIKNYQVLLDADVAEDIDPEQWECRTTRGTPYFRSVYRAGGVRRTIWLHRIVAGCPKGRQVDHKDRNTLDNRRANLRVCDLANNIHNRGIFKRNTTGFKGVTFFKATKRWHAQIGKDGKRIHLGFFKDIVEAAKAYNKAATELHGEFASLNKVEV